MNNEQLLNRAVEKAILKWRVEQFISAKRRAAAKKRRHVCLVVVAVVALGAAAYYLASA